MPYSADQLSASVVDCIDVEPFAALIRRQWFALRAVYAGFLPPVVIVLGSTGFLSISGPTNSGTVILALLFCSVIHHWYGYLGLIG